MDVSPTMGEYIFTNIMGRWIEIEWGWVAEKKELFLCFKREISFFYNITILYGCGRIALRCNKLEIVFIV